MKNHRHLEILDRSFALLDKLRSEQFEGLPANIQIDWLEKICSELFFKLLKVNCSHDRVILHSALGSVLVVAGEIGLQEALIDKLESQKKAKRAIDCHKTLNAYLYLKRLIDKLGLSEKDFLRDYRKIHLGALYVFSGAAESDLLTSEILDYLQRGFWIDKATAEALVENCTPKTNLIGDKFWVKKTRSGCKWGIPSYKKLGEKVRILRSESNISQAQLGEKIGLPAISIFHLEKGDRKLDAVELWLIAKEFATKSREFEILSQCLGEILEGRSGKEKLRADTSALSLEQMTAIGLYFSVSTSNLKLRSLVRESIALAAIRIGESPLKTSRIKANAKCGIAPYKNLGEKVRALRIQNNISRLQLSKQAGLAWVSVFHLERGDRRLDATELWSISKTFADSSSEFRLLLKYLEKVFEVKANEV